MKEKIRKTGEIVDVITYSGHTHRSDIDAVSYIDSKGKECVDVKMNIFWDFENVEEPSSTKESLIDWEERRFDLVKAYSVELIKLQMEKGRVDCGYLENIVSEYAISLADKVIADLKYKNNES